MQTNTSLPFDDDRWGVIVCSHVLEHVFDDASAMRELRRVLAPAGTAIIIVPRNTGMATDEDASVSDPAERRARFGQEDHVRMYGDDLEVRLRRAGFGTIVPIGIEGFSSDVVNRYQLRPTDASGDEAALFCSA